MITPSLYHWLPTEALEVSFTDPPTQKTVLLSAAMAGVIGNGFTITVISLEVKLGQLLPSVTTTVYFPAVVTV
ncbi:hypothetical protein D3C86_1908310 [compost metagenome]